MKLEQQVTNKEISKHLKELGVKQESFFYWVKTVVNENENWDLRNQNPKSLEMSLQMMHINGYCSAFTVAELGEMLKASGRSIESSLPYWDGKEWISEYYGPSFKATTEADARGKMLIYLLENKLITL